MRRPLLLACLLPALLQAPAPALHYAVRSECTYVYKSIAGSTSHVLVVVVAEAHATGELPAVTTTVTCEVRNAYGEQFVTRGVLPGPNVYWTGSAIFRWSTPEVCSTSSAVFPTLVGGTFVVDEPVRCRGAF